MKRNKWWWIVVWAVSACGAQSDPGTDSATQFWQTCRTQADCDGLSCLCGHCSRECDEAADCTQVGRSAMCAVLPERCDSPTLVCMPAEELAPDSERDSGTLEGSTISPDAEGLTDRIGPVFASVTVVPAPSLLAAPDGAGIDPQTYELEALAYTCEPNQTPEFTRSDCPTQAPSGPCDGEAQECRYLVTDTCAALHECTYGYWTMIREECVGEASDSTVISGATSCADHAPIPDSPCEEEGQVCGHAPCVLGGASSRIYTCTCGRWTVAVTECPRD